MFKKIARFVAYFVALIALMVIVIYAGRSIRKAAVSFTSEHQQSSMPTEVPYIVQNAVRLFEHQEYYVELSFKSYDFERKPINREEVITRTTFQTLILTKEAYESLFSEQESFMAGVLKENFPNYNVSVYRMGFYTLYKWEDSYGKVRVIDEEVYKAALEEILRTRKTIVIPNSGTYVLNLYHP